MTRAWWIPALLGGLITAGGAGCGEDDPSGDPMMMMADGGVTGDGGTAGDPDGGASGDVDGGEEPHEGDITLGRLLIADGEASEVHVVDLDEGEVLDTFEVDGAARVKAATGSRYGYAVQRGSDLVSLIDSGVSFMSHVDHYHVDKGAPSLMEMTIEGSQPTHFVLQDGWGASFFDGTGAVRYFQERSISAGAPTFYDVETGRAHHGVAVVAFGHLFATVPDPDDEEAALPVGVSIRPATSPDEVEDMHLDCPGLHGEAANESRVAFGCSDGVLVAEWHDDHFDVEKLDYPGEWAAGTRTGTLAAHHDAAMMVGNWSADAGSLGLMILDFEAATDADAFLTVPLDSHVLGFTFDRHGEHLLVLTADGHLHRLHADDGAPEGEPLEVMEAFEVEPGHGQVRPALTVGPDRAYIADPVAGHVLEVHLEDWEIERDFGVGGKPHSLAVFSMSPDFGEEHDHDHDHEGDHDHEDEHDH